VQGCSGNLLEVLALTSPLYADTTHPMTGHPKGETT
jgi:hypothetical protein